MKFSLVPILAVSSATCLFSATSLKAQDVATPPVPLEPALADSAASTTPHPAPVEVPHAILRPIALRVVGSNVKNPGGEYLGRIDNIVLDGESARAEYAMLVMNYPSNNTLYTPVPWGALNYVWDQAQAGGVPGALQVFLLNVDKATLERAPSIDRTQWSAIRQPELARQLAAFYGPTDGSAVGSAEAGGGTVAGSASGGPAVAAAGGVAPAGAVVGANPGAAFGADPAFNAGFPFFVSPGFVVFNTNFVGTNIVINTNVIVTNVVDGIQTNVVINLTNFPPDVASNVVSGSVGTNIFAGTPGFLDNPFRRSGINSDTNISGGGSNFVGGGSTISGTNFAGTPGFLGNRFPSTRINPGTNNAAAAAVGPGPLPGAPFPPGTSAGGVGVGAPTGRAATPFIGPVLPGTPVPGTAAGRSAFPPDPSSVAPPGVIAPQVPPPPASPIVPTMPGSAQRPSIPSSAAPPGTVAPQVPVTPPAAVPAAPQ